MLKIGDKVKYVGTAYVNLISKSGLVHDLDHANNAIVYFPDLEDGFDVGCSGIKLWRYGTGDRKYLIISKKDLEIIQEDDNVIKVGDLVEYIGSAVPELHKLKGVVVGNGILDGFLSVRFEDCNIISVRSLLRENLIKTKGDGSMKKILVINNTGNYATDAKKGDILNVIEERFGYVVTLSGKVKDIDYVDYKDGEMIAHINDLRDCFALGMKFDDENNLVYPDGKIALKGENVQYLDRTFKVKRFKDRQFVIGNEKVEICFGYNEIGKIVEFRR